VSPDYIRLAQGSALYFLEVWRLPSSYDQAKDAWPNKLR